MKNLRQVRWQTPASDSDGLILTSLSDGESDGLRVEVRTGATEHADGGQLIRFSFGKVPMYRATREEYRTGVQRPPDNVGTTHIIKLSAWLKELRDREPLLDAFDPDCEHYVISTENDVIEVLSSTAPTITVEGDHAP